MKIESKWRKLNENEENIGIEIEKRLELNEGNGNWIENEMKWKKVRIEMKRKWKLIKTEKITWISGGIETLGSPAKVL